MSRATDGEFADWLWREADLADLAIRVRTTNPSAYARLLRIRIAGLRATNRVETSGQMDKMPEVRSPWDYAEFSACQAASILDLEDRSVRLACAQGRMAGAFKDEIGAWRIPRASLEAFARRKGLIQ